MDFRYLRIDKSPTPQLLKILNNNIIGTPGHGMLYQHLRVDKKINRIADPYFVNLVRANQLAGTCCFCSRFTLNNSNPIRSFYVRYFSFQEIFRRRAIHKKKHRAGAIRTEVESLLKGNGLGVSPEEKFYFYAYVDPRNKRSALLCEEFGFEPVRQYTTVLFSRINPTESKEHSIVEMEVNDSVKNLLKDFYRGYNALSFENLDGRKYYFINDEAGQAVAGVLVNPDEWRIHSLPGMIGKLKLNVLSAFPILKKLINKKFCFLSYDAIYVKPGAEKKLEALLETLLFKFNVNTGICLVDANSNLYATLKSLDLGLANLLSKEVRGNVICRFVNFSNSEKDQFSKKAMYLSGIDAT